MQLAIRPELLLAGFAVTLLTACAGPDYNRPAGPPPAVPLAGAARDEHGCVPSAGYAWCVRTAQCERPWEVARQYNFPASPENVAAFCHLPPPAR